MRYSTNIANYCSTHMGYCDTLHEEQRRFVVLVTVTVFPKIRWGRRSSHIIDTNYFFAWGARWAWRKEEQRAWSIAYPE